MNSLEELKNSFPLVSVAAIRTTLRAKENDYDASAEILSTLDDPNEDRESILDRASFLADVDKIHIKNPRKTMTSNAKGIKNQPRKSSRRKKTSNKKIKSSIGLTEKPVESVVLSPRKRAFNTGNSNSPSKSTKKKSPKKTTITLRSPIKIGTPPPARPSTSTVEKKPVHLDLEEKENLKEDVSASPQQLSHDENDMDNIATTQLDTDLEEKKPSRAAVNAVRNNKSDMLLYLLMETPSRLAAEIMLGLYLMSKPETVCDIRFQKVSNNVCSPLQDEDFYISWICNNPHAMKDFRELLSIYIDHGDHEEGFDDWVSTTTTETINASVDFLTHFLTTGGYI